MRLWDLAWWMWNQKGRPAGWNLSQELTLLSWGRISSSSRKSQVLLFRPLSDWTRPLQCGVWSPLLKFWWWMKHHPQNTFMATSGWVFGWITGDWPSQADTGTDHHCICQTFCFAKSQHLYCYYCLLQATWMYIEVHYIWGAKSSREKGISFKDINL